MHYKYSLRIICQFYFVIMFFNVQFYDVHVHDESSTYVVCKNFMSCFVFDYFCRFHNGFPDVLMFD